MLKPDGPPERARSHGRRWALLLLLPLVVLLVWALVGIRLEVGNRRLQTYWKQLPRRHEPAITLTSVPTVAPRPVYAQDRDRYRWVDTAWALRLGDRIYFVRSGRRELRSPGPPPQSGGYPGALPGPDQR